MTNKKLNDAVIQELACIIKRNQDDAAYLRRLLTRALILEEVREKEAAQ